MLVGFAWAGADERKMVGTFGMGRAGFGCFVDLQVGPRSRWRHKSAFCFIKKFFLLTIPEKNHLSRSLGWFAMWRGAEAGRLPDACRPDVLTPGVRHWAAYWLFRQPRCVDAKPWAGQASLWQRRAPQAAPVCQPSSSHGDY